MAVLCVSLSFLLFKRFPRVLCQMDTRAEPKCLSNLPALIKGTDDRNQHNPLPCDQVVMFCLCKNNTIRNIVNLASSGGKHFRPARAKYGEETRPAEMVDGGVSPRRHLRAQRRLSLARGFYVLGGFSLFFVVARKDFKVTTSD